MKWLDDTPWRLECRPFVLHAILPRPSLDAGRRRGRPLMALLISTISGGITRLRDGLGRYDECPVTTAVKEWRTDHDNDTCLCLEGCRGMVVRRHGDVRMRFRGTCPQLRNVLGSQGGARLAGAHGLQCL
jgi:hypothetical protein